MDYADYQLAVTHLHAEIRSLADATADPAFLRAADPSSPEFLALMQHHIELVQMFTKLTERMFAHYKAQRSA